MIPLDWSLLVVPGAALVRNFAGWLENSAKDGEIQTYEWAQLGGTVIKYAVISVALMLGLNMDVVTASVIPVVADYATAYLNKALAK